MVRMKHYPNPHPNRNPAMTDC